MFRSTTVIALAAAALVAALATPTSSRAQTAEATMAMLRAKTLCAAYLSFHPGSDGRTQVAMTITDAQKRVRTRNFTILRHGSGEATAPAGRCGDVKFYLYFHRPADVNKTAFMVWTHQDRSDDRWIYLPALDLVKRIAATDERTSFVGSSFFYEDVAGRSPEADDFRLADTTTDYFVVKAAPKAPDTVEFSGYTLWIHRESLIPVKVEYLDKQAKAYRVYEVKAVETVAGRPIVSRSLMRDLRTGTETLVEFRRMQLDVGLPEDIFTERYLRSPPRTHLR